MCPPDRDWPSPCGPLEKGKSRALMHSNATHRCTAGPTAIIPPLSKRSLNRSRPSYSGGPTETPDAKGDGRFFKRSIGARLHKEYIRCQMPNALKPANKKRPEWSVRLKPKRVRITLHFPWFRSLGKYRTNMARTKRVCSQVRSSRYPLIARKPSAQPLL